MTCTQNRESGEKPSKMKCSSRSFFTLACDTFFMPPQSGRSHTFFLLSYIYYWRQWEHNKWSATDRVGGRAKRECVEWEKSVGTIACKLGEYTRKCSAISLPVDLSNFSFQLMPSFPASLTSHITLLQTGPADVTRRRRRLYDDEKFAIFNQRREKAIFHHIQMKKRPHSLQLAYQHYIYFFWWMFNKISLRLQLRPH